MFIEEYCERNNISRRHVFRKISQGDLKTTKIEGKHFILNSGTKKDSSIDISVIKKDWDNTIASCISLQEQLSQTIPESDREAIKERIKFELRKLLEQKEFVEKEFDVKISGYDYKSLRRKITKKKISRDSRSDKGLVRNHILNNELIQEKLLALAAHIYFRAAASNFSLITDLVREYAKRNEEYYEFAAVPRSTLYKFLNRKFTESGSRSVHTFLNHYNTFHSDLPKVSGAFTRDIRFMQYILGDDNLRDTYSVLVWDNSKRQWIEKRARIWLWVEALTMFPLGWTIKVGDFTTQDLINSLTQVLYQYGLPSEAIVIDNGIGRGLAFETYCAKLGLVIPNDETYALSRAVKLAFSEAYTPTNKAPVERSFGLQKNEFEVFSENFVSPDKKSDARHRDLHLSPEKPLDTFESYKEKLEAYLTGFFIERPRNRMTPEGRKLISIKDYFNNYYTTYVPKKIDKSKLRYAVCIDEIIKKFSNNLKFKGFTFMPDKALPFSYYSRYFKVLYNPADLSEIDLYALENLVNEDTGEFFRKGHLVTTLYNLEADPNKRERVAKLKNEIKKRARQSAAAVLSILETKTPDILPDKVSPNAEILEERKQAERDLANIINSKIHTIPILDSDIPPVELPEEECRLTIQEDEEENFSQLTFDEDESQ